MKILQAFGLFSLPHGAGTVDILYRLSHALADRGHEVEIYTSDFELDQDYVDSLQGVRVYSFRSWPNLPGLYLTPSIVAQASKSLQDFDIIHLHCYRSFQNIVIHHYAKKYGIPYLLQAHGSLLRHGNIGFKWLLRWLFDVIFGYRILRDATKVITENVVGAEEYKKFGVGEEKIVMIPLSFPVEEFSKLPSPGLFRRKFDIKENHIIMFLGRINWIKGLDFLVESFYQLTQLRNDTVLAMVGPDDGFKATLEESISKLNLSNRVLFTGFLGGEEKLSALVDADVVIQPSRYEQAAWAPIEAVLCGTPVIVSKNTGAGEDVSRMDAGYLVDYGDKGALIEAIQRIFDDPSEAIKKVRRAGEYIKANLTLTKEIEEYERLYTGCIKETEQLRSKK